MKIRINTRTWLVSLFVLCVPLSLALEHLWDVPYVAFVDEIFSVLMFLYLVYLAAFNQLEKQDAKILTILIFFTLIGIVSNIVSHLMENVLLIALDAFWQWKIFVSFLGAKYLSKYDYRNTLISSLSGVAKTLIVSAFICGLLSFAVDLGMTKGSRYGLPAFYFVFGNHGRYGIIIAVALLIVVLTNKDNIKYIFLAIADMIFSTKGVVFVIIGVFVLLWFVFVHIEKEGKLKGWMIFLVCVVVIGMSGYQITEYLMDETAPRMLLIRYGFITANTYFPLGSGFGTYGSDVAAKYYSPLYRQYGWMELWALRPNGQGLNDNYLATIVGECGYGGLALFLWLFWLIYKQVNAVKLKPRAKALMMSLFICMIVAFIATGITKSSTGVLVFAVIGILVGKMNKAESYKERIDVSARRIYGEY